MVSTGCIHGLSHYFTLVYDSRVRESVFIAGQLLADRGRQNATKQHKQSATFLKKIEK